MPRRKAAVVEREATPQAVQEWFICPQCKGEGIRTEEDPRRPWIRRKVLCSTCGGHRMVKLATNSSAARNLVPVRQCPECKNWYGIGGGHGPEETNAPPHDSRSHSHWHDLSFYPPPQ